jgi:spore maturation protein CgeB
MRKLDFSFFGSSLVSAYWNGAATYYRGILRALAARGHRITFYEPDAYERQAHRDIEDPSWAKVVVYSGTDAADVHRMLERARTADVIVKASGVGVWDELLEREVLAAKRSSGLAVFWDVDAPATLERLRRNAADPFRPLVRKYDAVFTYGGGPPVVREYESMGAKLCAPIYNALDPETHHPASREARWAADLSLLANRLPDREARIEEYFLRPARELPSYSFLLGGSGWDAAGIPSNVRAVGHVYTRDHNAFNASAHAVLNVARDSMAACGYSPATRVFEAAGAGACIITDAWPGIADFLEPDHEILVAEDGDDVVRHVRDLTSTRARAIGEAARRRVLSAHTYAKRAHEVEALLLQVSSVPMVLGATT